MAATAVEAWDEGWTTPEGRADWLVPHPAVAALVPVLRRAVRSMCSTLVVVWAGTRCSLPSTASASGRSTVPSPALTSLAARRPRAASSSVCARPMPMRCLSAMRASTMCCRGMSSFTARWAMSATVSPKIWRVLKSGGLYQGTMLSKRDAQFGRGRPIGRDTFIRGSDPKAHPHYYCDLAALATLFAGFELLSLTQEEQRRPDSWHWHILADGGERGRAYQCNRDDRSGSGQGSSCERPLSAGARRSEARDHCSTEVAPLPSLVPISGDGL
jgi:tellurite methyltransferase